MNQQEFNFNKNVNEITFTPEDNLRINEMVFEFQDKKNSLNDETIIINLFFEIDFIEITKKLKALSYFNGDWEFEVNSFGGFYYDFICSNTTFNSTTSLSEFIVLFFYKINDNIKAIDFQKNTKSDFYFDRKVTESILDKIQIGDISNAVLNYIIYLKIWNIFNIYNNPFNNNKALLIHRIFSEKVWPKNLISYESINEFEISIQKIINDISDKNIYFPFFDTSESNHYSENYLKERSKLKENIEKLFEYDLTDESEPYFYLIEDLINNPQENAYKKRIIISKIEKQMMPSKEDITMFLKLYNSPFEKELGKTLLSNFYLFNLLNYD
jgi:hypothetical protein